MTSRYILVHDEARRRAAQAVMDAPHAYTVTIKPPTRNLNQNAAQWPYLRGFSQQLQWPVNGEMCWLTQEEYKDVLTSAYEKEITPRLAMGWEGGVVMLGKRTSGYSKEKFSEWMEFLKCAAAVKGVTPVYLDGERVSV